MVPWLLLPSRFCSSLLWKTFGTNFKYENFTQAIKLCIQRLVTLKKKKKKKKKFSIVSNGAWLWYWDQPVVITGSEGSWGRAVERRCNRWEFWHDCNISNMTNTCDLIWFATFFCCQKVQFKTLSKQASEVQMEKAHLQQQDRWGGKLYCNHTEDPDIGTVMRGFCGTFS